MMELRWEIGYSYAKGKPVIGIRTDFRNGGDTEYGRVNAMIEGSCVGIAKDFEGVLALHLLKERHANGPSNAF